MFGFDPLTIGSALILASGGQCVMPEATKINVIPTTKDITYDFNQSLQDIQNIEIDTLNPYGFHDIAITQGFMKGGIEVRHQVQLAQRLNPTAQDVCLWYQEINVDIEIDPTIVIAKEVAADPCMKKAVLEHELKHIKADREVANKYARTIGNAIYENLESRGFTAGPMKKEHAQMVAERMQKTVFQIVEHEYKKMELERAEIQNSIDNIDEYERVNDQCPHFKQIQTQILEAHDAQTGEKRNFGSRR